MSPAPPSLTPPHRAQYPVASIVLPWLPPGVYCTPIRLQLYLHVQYATLHKCTTHTHRVRSLYPAVAQCGDQPHPPTVFAAPVATPPHTYTRATRGHPLPILSPQRHIILTARPLDCCSRPRAQHGVRVRLGVSGSPQETEGRHVPRRPLLSLPRHKQGRRHLQDR